MKYNFRNRFFVFIILFLITGIIYSCKSNAEKKHVNTIENMIGKNIIIPNNNIVLSNLEIDTIEGNCFNNTLKLVSFTDGRCPACIENLLKLMSLKKEFDNKFSVDIDFVNFVYVDNVKFFMNNFYSTLDCTMPLLMVDNYSFLKNNDLPYSPIYHTFLLNKDNEIVLVGNPANSKLLKELYIKQINNHINNN